MTRSLQLATLLLVANAASAATAPFQLRIAGEQFDVTKHLELSDIGEGKTAINFDFPDQNGKIYNFDLKYKKLPENRSYPSNLDITVKDGSGKKLGYLFWANNGVAALKRIGTFGLVIDVDGKPVDLRFVFDSEKQGNLQVTDLGEERLVQDTLVPKFGFQMIRPVIVPLVDDGIRTKTFSLDHHPYAVNYTLKDIAGGNVEFQFNFYRKENGNAQLLERIYYHADSLETLREGMFAGKYFDDEAGSVKLVYYPAQGQTQPDAQ